MFALPKPERVEPEPEKEERDEAAPEQEDRSATRQRVLDLTVREGPARDHRWHSATLKLSEQTVRTADGGLVTLKEGSVTVWAHFDDFAHWGERKSGRE